MTTELFMVLLLVVAVALGYTCYSDLRKDIQTMAIALEDQQRKNHLAQAYQLDEIEKAVRQISFRLRDSNIMTNEERARDREERMNS